MTIAENEIGTQLRLDPRLDVTLLASVFQRAGRIHIPGILDSASAKALHADLAGDVPWQMHYNDGATVYDIEARQVDALDEAQRLALRRPMQLRARTRFQYCFDNFSLSDHCESREFAALPVMRALEFMNSPAVLEFARKVTGIAVIASADAQATRYRVGDFLTAHDDREEGKGRVAAYVLSMTPAWRSDWGGILQFLDRDGHVAEGYVPTFNALNIFRVPQLHNVSLVAPCAGHARLSITGWFRR